MRARIDSGSARTSWPSTVVRPELGALVPASSSSSAELRAADGPATAVNVAGRAVNEISVSTSRPSTASPSWYAVTPMVRAPGLSGNRWVELSAWVRKEGRETRRLRVIIRSIRPRPLGCSSVATGGADGGTGGAPAVGRAARTGGADGGTGGATGGADGGGRRTGGAATAGTGGATAARGGGGWTSAFAGCRAASVPASRGRRGGSGSSGSVAASEGSGAWARSGGKSGGLRWTERRPGRRRRGDRSGKPAADLAADHRS